MSRSQSIFSESVCKDASSRRYSRRDVNKRRIGVVSLRIYCYFMFSLMPHHIYAHNSSKDCTLKPSIHNCNISWYITLNWNIKWNYFVLLSYKHSKIWRGNFRNGMSYLWGFPVNNIIRNSIVFTSFLCRFHI